MSQRVQADFVVIGGGPAGQKAAVQAAKEGHSVALVDLANEVGGECVRRGTIPSKTLRETAVTLTALRSRTEGVLDIGLAPDLKVASLMRRLRSVLTGHQSYMRDQLERNGIALHCGKARLVGRNEIRVEEPGAGTVTFEAGRVVLATGSRPRRPDWLHVDHEHVLDSDSILSLIYLPSSLVVLGGGVIACEFASVMAALGVDVTMVDKYDRPLGFLDPELTDRFLSAFERAGGTFLGGRETESVAFDAISSVETRFADGSVLKSEKVLCALGRVACVEGLGLEEVGVEVTERGFVSVDEDFVTSVPEILAVGDVVGPPALAATAMDQGRRAVRRALGLETVGRAEHVPVGIYTIPELASVGLTEAAVKREGGEALVGRAPFSELARGQITGNVDGLLKLVFDGTGKRLLGAQVVGEGATELVHVAQMALYAGLGVDALLENTFNFPTLGEAYRVAALDVRGQLARRAGCGDDQPQAGSPNRSADRAA